MRQAPTAAVRLIEALGLETRATAEVQDLYSRPIASGSVLLIWSRDGVLHPQRAAA